MHGGRLGRAIGQRWSRHRNLILAIGHLPQASLKDQFGVSWQIVPKVVPVAGRPRPEKGGTRDVGDAGEEEARCGGAEAGVCWSVSAAAADSAAVGPVWHSL